MGIHMFTRQHYKVIAEIVKEAVGLDGTETDAWIVEHARQCGHQFTDRLADYFAKDNPRFDRAKFLAACGLE